MADPVEMVIIMGQQKIDLHDVLNLVQIEITDGRILQLKSYINLYYKPTPIDILFPSLITNDKKQIFVTCRKLNDGKIAPINGKVCNVLGVINLDKQDKQLGTYKGKIMVVKFTFCRTRANKQ